MNKSYRIDKDYIFTTDENGEIRKLPKYENIEAILKTEDAIEVISESIAGKDENIYDIEHDSDFINLKSTLIMRFAYTVFMGVCGVLCVFAVVTSHTILALLALIGLGLSGFESEKYSRKSIRGLSLRKKYNNLHNEKEILTELKEQNMDELEEFKKVVNPSMLETGEKTVATDFLNDLKHLRALIFLLQDYSSKPVSKELQQISDTLQGVETQRQLMKRFKTWKKNN